MEVKLDEHQLDEGQMKAVKHFEGPALVVAGPGSGKTNVIKDRILNLIREHNVDPERILAIAFTNAAAEEMDERLKNEPLLNHSKPRNLHFTKYVLSMYLEKILLPKIMHKQDLKKHLIISGTRIVSDKLSMRKSIGLKEKPVPRALPFINLKV